MFRYETSLVGSIYPTSPDDCKEKPPKNEEEARSFMLRRVSERGKYYYSLKEKIFTYLLANLCCCLVRNKEWFKKYKKRLDRHEEAKKKL